MPEWLKRWGKSDIRNSLAVVIVLGCFVLLYILQVKEIPIGNKDVVLTAVGFVFGGALAGVIGYYYGNTKIDNKKDE
jgi:hypothetical protein